MVTLVPYNPDGQPVRGRKDRLHVFERSQEERAKRSAARAWWTRKGEPREIPEGATLRIGVLVRPSRDEDSGLLMVLPPNESRPRKVRDDDLRAPDGRVFFGEAAPAYRWERVPVVDPETDEVIDTRLKWVDLREERRKAEESRLLEEAKSKHAAKKAARAAAARGET